MKRLFLTTLLASLALLLQSQTSEKNFIDQNYIEVSGKAQMKIIPDMFNVRIQISEKDSKPKTSIEELEKTMISKFKDIGIDVSKDLSINDLSSSFQRHLIAKTDISVSKEYLLTVNNTNTLFKVFTVLESIGISNTRVTKVESSKIEEYRNEVKVKAVKAAKDKAAMLASAINQTIGRAIFIQENSQYQTSERMTNAVFLNAPPEEETDQSLDFEKINIEYSVLVRFELK